MPTDQHTKGVFVSMIDELLKQLPISFARELVEAHGPQRRRITES
jgi:hypothetical protein